MVPETLCSPKPPAEAARSDAVNQSSNTCRGGNRNRFIKSVAYKQPQFNTRTREEIRSQRMADHPYKIVRVTLWLP
jgi:hypothetical protein